MNSQEIFNRVVTHLKTQNAQAVDGDGTCLYRTETGLTCAVGCLIKDKHYSSKLENISPDSHESDNKVNIALRKSLGYVSNRSLDILEGLQRIHDHVQYSIKGFDGIIRDLESLAEEYKLDASVINTKGEYSEDRK